MAHLNLDTLILHELELSIADETIEERRPEWNAVLTAKCREHFVKGVVAFCGMELLDYETADIRRNQAAAKLDVKIRSKNWVALQPR